MLHTRSNRRHLRLLTLVGLVVALSALALPVANATTTYSGTSMQWNMSGWSKNRGSTSPANKLVQLVLAATKRPLFVVTNETCKAQYVSVRDQLAPYGYISTWSPSLTDPTMTNCTEFGNAVFWQKSSTGTDVVDFARPYPDDAQVYGSATAEKRNMTCVHLASPNIHVCATHLHQDDPVARRQLTYANTWMQDLRADGVPTFLAGDLNVVPRDSSLDPWYNGAYAEADLSGRNAARATTTGFVKLDYLFVPKPPGAVTKTAGISFQLAYSDHAVYTGNFSVPTG